MRRITIALALVALAGVAAGQRVPGAKSPRCPVLEATLAELEQQAPVFPHLLERRIRILRNRIADRCVALNEVQVLGTHNSYHVQPKPDLFALLVAFSPEFRAWEFTHLPLETQLETQGIRQVEIDVFADPDGGLYARRGGLVPLGQNPVTTIPQLRDPGFKVLHVQDLDFQTRCFRFVDCLRDIRRWSDQNRGHLPLMVLVEAKDEPIPDPFNFGFAIPHEIGTAAFDALDAEIRAVFPEDRLITPDDIRRGRATLDEAVRELGWPRLGAVRGKLLFALDNGGAKRAAYLAGHPALEGRVLFTDALPGDADAAFVKMNDPLPDPSLITDLVTAGYIVRTRADADTMEARSGETARRDAAIASGAQFVSTDYPVANPVFGTGYAVVIPGAMPGRCNPVNAPAGCRTEALERLR